MESFRNEFVVHVERTAFGWQWFRVISTRGAIRKLVEGLTVALEQPESRLRPDHLPAEAPTPLWQACVTQGFGRSDRRVLTFEIVPDLETYHRLSCKQAGEMSRATFYVLIIVLSVCAIVGAGFLFFLVFRWLTG